MDKITPQNIMNASDEQLIARRNELMAMKKPQTRDKDVVEAERYGAVANKLLETDYPTAIEMMQKQSELKAKSEEKAIVKIKQADILKRYNVAVDAWSKDKENEDNRTAINNLRAEAKTVDLTLPDVVNQWISEKIAITGQGLAVDRLKMEQKARADALELDKKRLSLDQVKFEAEKNKSNLPRLSDGAVDKLNLVNTLKTNIVKLKSVVNNIINKGLSFSDTQDYSNALNWAIQALGRAVSGAAIGDKEANQFDSLLGWKFTDAVDGGASYLKRLDSALEYADGAIASYATGGHSIVNPTPTGNSGTVTPPPPPPATALGEATLILNKK